MMPPGNLLDPASDSALIHPWSVNRTEAFQWGPVAISNPSMGVLYKLWKAEVVNNAVFVSSDTTPSFLAYTHSEVITDISLAFDQNGALAMSFMDVTGSSYYRWWDPTLSGYTVTLLDGFSPRMSLDDARPFNIAASDVILGYTRAGKLRYRLQRDRYSVEYTPLSETTTQEISALVLYHVSMSAEMKFVFMFGNTLESSALNSFRFLAPLIMKQHIVRQKAPVEELPITFDFGHVLAFGDAIVSAATVVTVETGTDPNPDDMVSGSPSNTDTTVTQLIVGGLEGNVYRIAISVGTSDSCIYVTEGLIYVNNSPGIAPP